MTEREFESAVYDLLEEKICPETFAELQNHLRASAEARGTYGKMVCLHSLLQEERGHLPCAAGRPPIQMDRVVARQKRRMARIALGAGIAAVVALMLVAVFILAPSSPAPPLAQLHGSSLAQLTVMHATPEGKKEPAAGTLEVGSRVKLRRGSLEVELQSGVRALVRGPADFTLRRENLVGLDSGTAWFYVPERAVGFVVETPELVVKDLGTEFGVYADPEALDEVHVFEGRVEVRHLGDEASVLTLKKGEARRKGTDDQWATIEPDAEKFFTKLPSIAELPPHLHWSFDGVGEEVVAVTGEHPDLSGIRIESSAGGGDREQVSGRVGKGVRVGRESDAIRTNWQGVGGDRPRTIAFWLKLPTGHSPAGRAQRDLTMFYWGGERVRGPDRNLAEHWAVRIVGEGRELNLEIGRVNDATSLRGRTLLNDGEWHHLAVVYNGEVDRTGQPVIKMFIDGKSELFHVNARPMPLINTETDPKKAKPLWIASSRTGVFAPFTGELDEVYIFDGRVEDSVIYELAHPTKAPSSGD